MKPLYESKLKNVEAL